MPDWFCWYCASRCVPFRSRQAQDAPHHGRYELEGQSCSGLVLLVLHLALCSTDACHHGRYGPEGAVRAAVQKTSDIFRSSSSSRSSFSLSWCRADSHGPCDHRVYSVARGYGGRCPYFAGRASTTGAVVEKTVVLPQFDLLRNS